MSVRICKSRVCRKCRAKNSCAPPRTISSKLEFVLFVAKSLWANQQKPGLGGKKKERAWIFLPRVVVAPSNQVFFSRV